MAPYQVHVVPIGGEPEILAAASALERDLESAGLDVLVDDRDERPGVKFKDADLIGIPLRVTIGKRALDKGLVEVKWRAEPDLKKVELLPLASAVETLIGWCRRELAVSVPRAS